MANQRLFYAAKKAGIAPLGSNSYTPIKGLQSIGLTTTFNLEQVFEIGQLAIYENIEGIPDVSVDLEKVLDGSPPIYTLATQLGSNPALTGRSAARSHLAISVYDAEGLSATGTPQMEVLMSGMYVNSVGYSVSVDANATESVSLIGNDKVWVGFVTGYSTNASYLTDPFVSNEDAPTSITGSGGVNRREDVLFLYSTNVLTNGVDANGVVSGIGTVLPKEIPGISTSGTNDRNASEDYSAHVQSFSTSVDFGREDLFELGRRGNYHKFLNFPTEVTTEIGIISASGDLVSVLEAGTIAGAGSCAVGTNLTDQTIRLHMCEGLQLNLGKKNKLSSVGVTGGDAGGGNEEITYTYTNFNDFVVYHHADPAQPGDSDFDPNTPAKF